MYVDIVNLAFLSYVYDRYGIWIIPTFTAYQQLIDATFTCSVLLSLNGAQERIGNRHDRDRNHACYMLVCMDIFDFEILAMCV